MYSWLTPFPLFLSVNLLGEQKSGQKWKEINLALFQKLKIQEQCYWGKKFNLCCRKFDICQGPDAGLFERSIFPACFVSRKSRGPLWDAASSAIESSISPVAFFPSRPGCLTSPLGQEGPITLLYPPAGYFGSIGN
jgi:hypothetical protein